MLCLGLLWPSSAALRVLVEGRLFNLGLLIYFVIEVCLLGGGTLSSVVHLIVLHMVQILVVALAKSGTSLLQRSLDRLVELRVMFILFRYIALWLLVGSAHAQRDGVLFGLACPWRRKWHLYTLADRNLGQYVRILISGNVEKFSDRIVELMNFARVRTELNLCLTLLKQNDLLPINDAATFQGTRFLWGLMNDTVTCCNRRLRPNNIKTKLVSAVLPYLPNELTQLVHCEMLADHKTELLVRLKVTPALMRHVSLHRDRLKVDQPLLGCNRLSISLLDTALNSVHEERNLGGATKS